MAYPYSLNDNDRRDILSEFDWDLDKLIEEFVDNRQEIEKLKDTVTDLEDKNDDLQKEIDDHECA